jgi:purine-binding chemotaxis protein CheW
LPPSAAPDDGRKLVFDLGGEAMAMPAAAVREIVAFPRIARVPHAPEALIGVANIRGVIVPVLSVASLLGRAGPEVRRVIVAEIDGPVGLAVGGVSHMVEAADGAVASIDVAALVARAVPKRPARISGAGVVAAAASEASETEGVALVSFAAGGQDFALPLPLVEEILRFPRDLALLPHGDAAIVGSMALRGAVLPLLSLAALLGLPTSAPTRRSRIVAVRIGAHRVGIVVEAMRGLERVPEADVDAVPQVLNRGGGEARVQAICRIDGGNRLISVLSPELLLDEDITARLLAGTRQGDEGMAGEAEKGAESERFLLFRIGAETFGMPISAVLEVALLPARLTALPKAPAFVRGVMKVRGEVVPVIDQAHRFGAAGVEGSKARVIVARIGELTAGFVVDAVSQVAQIPAGDLQPAPDLGAEGTRVFDRVATLGGETLVLVVSPRELLDRAERDLLLNLGTKSVKSKT